MTSILIIAHAPLASALKAVAQHAYPDAAANVFALDVPQDASEQQVVTAARAELALRPAQDTLVFTDVFGATPCRGASLLLSDPRVRVVAGVNVPMIWRTLCYGTGEPLDALVIRATAGATQGVIAVSASPPQNQSPRVASHDQAGRQDQ